MKKLLLIALVALISGACEQNSLLKTVNNAIKGTIDNIKATSNTTLQITFSREYDDTASPAPNSALTETNYTITGGSTGLTVSSVAVVSSRTVELTTDSMEAATYTISFSNIHDASGNALATSGSTTFAGDGLPEIVYVYAADEARLIVHFSEDIDTSSTALTAITKSLNPAKTIDTISCPFAGNDSVIQIDLVITPGNQIDSTTVNILTLGDVKDKTGNTQTTTLTQGALALFTAP